MLLLANMSWFYVEAVKVRVHWSISERTNTKSEFPVSVSPRANATLYTLQSKYETFSAQAQCLRMDLHKLDRGRTSVCSCWLAPCWQQDGNTFPGIKSCALTLLTQTMARWGQCLTFKRVHLLRAATDGPQTRKYINLKAAGVRDARSSDDKKATAYRLTSACLSFTALCPQPRRRVSCSPQMTNCAQTGGPGLPVKQNATAVALRHFPSRQQIPSG